MIYLILLKRKKLYEEKLLHVLGRTEKLENPHCCPVYDEYVIVSCVSPFLEL
jgi:hypothetical protein